MEVKWRSKRGRIPVAMAYSKNMGKNRAVCKKDSQSVENCDREPPTTNKVLKWNAPFLRLFAKMTGMGGPGGISYFSWTRGGTRVSHAKFQVSRSIPSYRYFLQKLGEGAGGGRGGAIILNPEKACLFDSIKSGPEVVGRKKLVVLSGHQTSSLWSWGFLWSWSP